MEHFSNDNLDDIVTPVNAEAFKYLLIQANYPRGKVDFLYDGFTNGFDMKYEGPLSQVRRFAPNLKLRVGSPTQLWNKVMAEVKLKRFAGPFKEPPFKYFVQSPIGLVPKDKGLKTCLIFHLSYPRNGDSVNSAIPKRFCRTPFK